MTVDPDALKKEIVDAFAGVPYPGDGAIVDFSSSLDESPSYVHEFFKGKHWKTLPAKPLYKHHLLATGLLYMTPAGFQFFLPGFMLIVIDNGIEPSSDAYGSVLDNLAPPIGGVANRLKDVPGVSAEDMAGIRRVAAEGDAQIERRRTEHRERMSVFNAAQRQAIISYLEFMKARYPQDSEGADAAIGLFCDLH